MNARYNPIARFYRLWHETRSGASIELLADIPDDRPPGRIVVSCSPKIDLASIAARWIGWAGECAAVVDDGSRPLHANTVQNGGPFSDPFVSTPVLSR